MTMFVILGCKLKQSTSTEQNISLVQDLEVKKVLDDTLYFEESLALTQNEIFTKLEDFPMITDTTEFILKLKENCHLNSYGYKRDWQITQYEKLKLHGSKGIIYFEVVTI